MKKISEKYIIVALKGYLMGAANVIPGVSGGTVALITGIYSTIIDSINALTVPAVWKDLFHGKVRDFWSKINGWFLVSLGFGLIFSILSLAKFMEYVLANFPVQTWSFFFGLIIASAVIMFMGIKGWTWKEVLLAILGGAVGVAVCMMTPTETPDSLWFIAICGAIAICSMMLPGISGSLILVILGKYDYIMTSLDFANFNWPVIIAFAIGCIIGVLAFTKFLHWLLGKWEKQTLIVLLGFIIGSLIKVWPWQAPLDGAPSILMPAAPDGHILWAIVWCVLGVGVVVALELFSRRKSK